MRTLLVYPYCLEQRLHAEDARVVPMGVYYVAAALKADGYPVQVLNGYEMDRDPEAIAQMLAEYRPEVIGFSILHANRWGGLDIARIAKRVDPRVKIVFGGIGATHLWRHFLTHFPEVDYVVLGEGEHTFLRLIRALESGDEAAADDIRGLALRKGGRPVRNPPRPPVEDLDSLPNPARYFDYRHLALTRGCPGRCTFCGSPGFWGKTVRFHSAGWFVDQLERLALRGSRFFFFSDDTFTLDRQRVRDVCRMILQRGLEISWAAISRVDAVDEETLLWMRRAGCIQISYGVESGSERIRRLLAKRISADQIRRAFALTTRYGILARAYFIYGCPGESRATIQDTLDLMDAIAPLGAVFYILDLFPGTALYAAYRKKHRVSDDMWLEHIEDIPYFETDPALTRRQVLAFGRTLRKHFYNHLPRYVEAVDLIDLAGAVPAPCGFLLAPGHDL